MAHSRWVDLGGGEPAPTLCCLFVDFMVDILKHTPYGCPPWNRMTLQCWNGQLMDNECIWMHVLKLYNCVFNIFQLSHGFCVFCRSTEASLPFSPELSSKWVLGHDMTFLKSLIPPVCTRARARARGLRGPSYTRGMQTLESSSRKPGELQMTTAPWWYWSESSSTPHLIFLG